MKTKYKKKIPTHTFDLGLHCDFLVLFDTQGIPYVKENMFLGIKDKYIETIAPMKNSFKFVSKQFIHQKNHLTMPGLINGHSHLAMTLLRGIEDDLNLNKWLFERIFPLEKTFVSPSFVKAGAALAALECIRFGTTTVNDMYFFTELTAKIFDQAGLRGQFSWPLMSFPTPENEFRKEDPLILATKLFEKYHHNERISIGLAPHAPYTCSDDLLLKILQKSNEINCPIHIHVAETKKEVEDSLTEFKKTPIKRLFDLGILHSKTQCAHLVHLNDEDMDLLKYSRAKGIYNPDSNMKLASGIAPITKLLSKNIPMALGTDGSASKNDLNLFSAMNVGTKLQKVQAGSTEAFSAKQMIYMTTLGGAKLLGLEKEIGSLEVGKYADIIQLNLHFPHYYPRHDLISHLVYSTTGLEVDLVICHGKILFQENSFLTLNESAITKNAIKYEKLISKELKKLQETNTGKNAKK